jgi:hypothetical protein
MRNSLALILLVLAIGTTTSNADQVDELNPHGLQFSSFQSRQSQLSDLVIDSNYKCEALNTDILPLCKDIAYNETRFPNFMKQKTQQEAATDTNMYLPLIRINCSPVLKLFLCSLYAPPCVKNYSSAIRPCRELCEKAKSGCEDFMKRFSFAWPDYIECNRFPPFNGPEACITDDNYSNQPYAFINQQSQPNKNLYQSSPFALQPASILPSQSDKLGAILTSLTQQQQQILLNSLTSVSSVPAGLDFQNKNYAAVYAAAVAAAAAAAAAAATQQGGSGVSLLAATSSPRIKFVCPPALQLLSDTKNTYYLNVQDEVVNNCAMPCDNILFDRQEVEFARSWVLIWSSLCFSSTLFTILTFMIETSRFR